MIGLRHIHRIEPTKESPGTFVPGDDGFICLCLEY
jgi:hypothetical protein